MRPSKSTIGFIIGWGAIGTFAISQHCARSQQGPELVLYADPAKGDDSSACTDPAKPCRTIQGAMSKVPRPVKARATVNMAPGHYE